MIHFDKQDMTAGAVLGGFGLFVAVYAGRHYDFGTTASMGPGYFPVVLGAILAALGGLIMLLSIRRVPGAPYQAPFGLRPLIAVLLAVLVFAGLILKLGLVPATIALTLVASLAEPKFHLQRATLLGISLALLSWLIFKVGLKMPLPAFLF
ncbi:tripartite tricarboxylate transporter TctB family protein [Thalassovita sp.]|uniref:tripartite tricarboxylate transporter TctB family protein n=1 Tax=Thalassovita sp. TaxID=1979401 RepID=UPI0029DE7848|nr:tripartite tricarboxylate transporter TctB family protein [Thalassovita sp.]